MKTFIFNQVSGSLCVMFKDSDWCKDRELVFAWASNIRLQLSCVSELLKLVGSVFFPCLSDSSSDPSLLSWPTAWKSAVTWIMWVYVRESAGFCHLLCSDWLPADLTAYLRADCLLLCLSRDKSLVKAQSICEEERMACLTCPGLKTDDAWSFKDGLMTEKLWLSTQLLHLWVLIHTTYCT